MMAETSRGAAGEGPAPRTAEDLRRAFDSTTPFTVGLEEEVLLVDRTSHAPVPLAEEILWLAEDRTHLKPEVPAAQVELVSEPRDTVAEAIGDLEAARRALAQACAGLVLPVAAAVHPGCPDACVLRGDDRSRVFGARYGPIAEQQLIGALQVHVALGDADRTLAVHNALRSHLPEIAALAAAAPHRHGHDTGLASVRPLIAGQLPRQGVPPAIASWEALADDLAWGASSSVMADPGQWWWELRPHVRYGTLELRVPDVQPTLAATAAVVSTIVALVRHLVDRHDHDALTPPAPTWRIAENRWSALRHGVTGELADLETGECRPTRVRLSELLDRIEPHADGDLDAARGLVDRNSALDLREVGPSATIGWLAEVFEP